MQIISYYVHAHTHIEYMSVHDGFSFIVTKKKKFYSGLLNILFIYYKKKIIDVMVHIGDHKNQNQWVFIFSRRMKNSLIEFNGIR